MVNTSSGLPGSLDSSLGGGSGSREPLRPVLPLCLTHLPCFPFLGLRGVPVTASSLELEVTAESAISNGAKSTLLPSSQAREEKCLSPPEKGGLFLKEPQPATPLANVAEYRLWPGSGPLLFRSSHMETESEQGG